jgi:hypothetical protein
VPNRPPEEQASRHALDRYGDPIQIALRSGGIFFRPYQRRRRAGSSLFASTNDWDDQLENYESGWPGFFEVLRLYLAHFTGAKAACFHVMGSVKGDQPETWKRLTELLRVSGANVGDRWTAERPEGMSGRVSRLQQGPEERYVMLLLEKPRTGIAQIGTYGVLDAPETNISIGLYFYGDDAGQQAASSEPIWQSWFADTFKPSWCGSTDNSDDLPRTQAR